MAGGCLRGLAAGKGLGAIALALLAACGGAPGGAGPQRLHVVMRDYSFQPSEVTLRAGAPIDLRLRNRGRITHDWTLMSPDGEEVSHVVVLPGEGGRDRLTLSEGEYALFCSIEGHVELGMVGTVEAR